MVIGEFGRNPIHQLLQEFAFDCPTGFADGRQYGPSPLLRTVLVERPHQQTVRCADEIHVAGLPLAVAHLAIAEPQFLLAVPMKRLGGLIARHKIQQGLLFFLVTRNGSLFKGQHMVDLNRSVVYRKRAANSDWLQMR